MQEIIQLANDVSRCHECVLRNRCKRTVPGVGVPGADVMAVGQAPDKQADQLGVAFVGPAGQFLSAMLESLGFTARRVYYTNIVKCFPGRGKGGDIKPPAFAIEACTPWLRREYEMVQPKVILAIGDVAMKFFGVKGGIKKNTGKVFYTDWGPVVPILHPAGLTKTPSNTPAFATGLHILDTHLEGYWEPSPYEPSEA